VQPTTTEFKQENNVTLSKTNTHLRRARLLAARASAELASGNTDSANEILELIEEEIAFARIPLKKLTKTEEQNPCRKQPHPRNQAELN